MGSTTVQLLLLLLLVMLGCSCNAIYEDQIGVWDWHQQYIGRVKHAVFQTHGSGRKRVVVATENGVISSLNLRTGEIFWRQVLEENEPIDGLEVALGKYAISLSRGGLLRSWHLPDGALIWETLLHASASVSASPAQLLLLPIDLNGDRSNDLTVLKGGKIFAVSSTDGRVIWTADLHEDRLFDASLSFEGNRLCVGGLSGSSLVLYRVDATDGTTTNLETDEAFQSSGFVITGGVLVALDTEGLGLTIADMSGEVLEAENVNLTTLIPEASGRAQILSAKTTGACALSVDGFIYVLGIQDGAFRVLQKIQVPAAVSNSISLDEGTSALSVVRRSSYTEVSVHVIAGDEASEEIIQLENRGSVQKVFLNAYTRTDRSRGFRVLVVGEDDSLSLLQQGKVVWTREDALASIVDSTIAELPLEKAGVSVAEVEHDLAEWLKGHILRLKSTLMLATAEEQAALQALRLHSAEKTKMFRDHNGFRKLIIVLTRSGKLFALHTGDGRIVWSLLISKLKAYREQLKLFPWQISHHHALDKSPIAMVLGTSQGKNGAISWVDMHTGMEQGFLELSYPVKQAFSLPLIDSEERRLHLFIDDENKAHLHPSTSESLRLFEDYMQNVFFYLVDKERGLMEGYNMKARIHSDADKQKQGYVFDTHRLWSVVFPRESERIAATAVRRADEVVHTQAKVLGNRDVLYKYLNKNMVFVATVTPQDSVVGSANPEETWLVAYLIDSVTGQVLHRVSHSHAQGPVHAVFSENWVVYYYFNVRNHRHEMSVLEVYDRSSEIKDVLQLMLGRYNASVPFTSFSPRNLEVKGQSYFFSSTVRAMTVTVTAKGITGKQVLVGTVGNQVIALDKRFFDPRRSLSPTPAEREEGIIPLTDGLPIFPQSYISHSARIEGLRRIVTVPASLESTCLVFAYGIDLFYTRTAPSRTYDSLTEDFSYALLLITIVALVIAIAVSMVMAQRKELREKWK